MARGKLKVATCQFPVRGDIAGNARYIRRFVAQAAGQGCDVVHFSETALSGYAGIDFPTAQLRRFDWARLREETQGIMALAQESGVWVVLGSMHYVDGRVKPTNCLYVISDKGEIVERYDKSMLAGKPGQGDLAHFTAGNHRAVVTLKGIKCGLAICADSCYPPLYNAYRHAGVRVMFNSFHNAGVKGRLDNDEFVPAIIRARAFDYSMWVVANNSSARHQCWPTCIASPRGVIEASLRRHRAGMLCYEIPVVQSDHNAFTSLMGFSANEVYHRGVTSKHRRVTDEKSLP